MKTLIHIIPTVENGGAETVLARLVEEWNNKGVQQFVITSQGSVSDHHHSVLSSHCTLIHAQEDQKRPLQCLRAHPEAKILAWMYKGIRHAYKWRKLAQGQQEIIWNIRRSNFSAYEWKQQLGLLLYGALSQWLKARIIFCAHTAQKAHSSYGFYLSNSTIIGNRLAKKKQKSSSSGIQLPPSFFLYVGRYNHAKGPDRLLRLFEQYMKASGDIPLVIAGRGWKDIPLSPSIKEDVLCLGNVSNLDTLYHDTTALLFTSYTEGYPNVVVEAVTHGTPVIGFEAGDSKHILQGYPFGYTVESNKSFLTHLNSLAKNPPTTEARLAEAKKQQQKFDFSLTLTEYEQFIWND